MRYLLILLLLSGCSVREYGEISSELEEPIMVICYSHSELSSNTYIRSGKAIGRMGYTEKGYKIDVMCDEVDGLLTFTQPYVAGHEIQHILHKRYPDIWMDPDIIDNFHVQSHLEGLMR